MMTLEQTLQAATDSGKITGAVAMIGNRDGVIQTAAAGIADAATGTAMHADTIFQIASMTKALASVAAMQLAERGALTLDDPIGTWVPELADVQVLTGFGADGAPMLRVPAAPITLRHLLTHTSGLGYSFMSADMARAQGQVAPGSIASITSPLLFDPGTRWEYGVSTDWVGRAVEAASGQTLGAYMAENIFEPLGMTDTGFSVSPQNAPRRAALQMRADGGGFVPFPIEIGGGEAAEFHSGGGGLYSTAGDYMRFLRMLLCGGKLDGHEILTPESVAQMSRNQIGALRAGRMDSIVPQFSGTFDSFPGMDTKWGLGFLINPEHGPNGRAPGSLAWAGIANTYYWIDPQSGIAGLVMMQFLPFGDDHALDLFAAVERAAYKLN
jgi:CubicO group peptidase (beta-lactamase class C family)